jgi:hypothetical protein
MPEEILHFPFVLSIEKHHYKLFVKESIYISKCRKKDTGMSIKTYAICEFVIFFRFKRLVMILLFILGYVFFMTTFLFIILFSLRKMLLIAYASPLDLPPPRWTN